MDTRTRTAQVAEIVTFRLTPGTTAEAFTRAARATEPLLRAQPSFLRRRLTQGSDGTWTDWAANAAAETVMQAAAFAPFMALIDGPTVTMRHDTIALAMD